MGGRNFKSAANTAGSALVPRAKKTRQLPAFFKKPFRLMAVSLPITLILILTLSDGTAAGRPVLLRTLHGALDPERAQLKPRVLGDMPPDVLSELAATSPVVEVDWKDEHHCRVRAAPQNGQWVEKNLSFSRGDPITERAKAIAYTVAAMMPQWFHQGPQQAHEDQPLPEVVALSVSDLSPPPEVATPAPVVVTESTPAPSAPTEKPSTPVSQTLKGFVGLSGLGTGPSLAGGPQLDVALCPILPLCFGASVNATFGSLADGNFARFDLRLGGFAEGRWLLWLHEHLGLNARIGGGAQRVSVQRGDESQMRWVGIGSIEGGLFGKRGPVEISLSGGVQWSGRTQVTDDVQRAEITPINGFGRLGVAWSWE